MFNCILLPIVQFITPATDNFFSLVRGNKNLLFEIETKNVCKSSHAHKCNKHLILCHHYVHKISVIYFMAGFSWKIAFYCMDNTTFYKGFQLIMLPNNTHNSTLDIWFWFLVLPVLDIRQLTLPSIKGCHGHFEGTLNGFKRSAKWVGNHHALLDYKR